MIKKEYIEFVDKTSIINRIDIKNKFEFVMNNFLKLLNFDKKEDVIGKLTLKDILKDVNKENKIEEILEYISTNKEWSGFVKLKRNNVPEYVWVKLILIPFYLNGVKSGYQLIIEKPSKEDIRKEEKKEEEGM